MSQENYNDILLKTTNLLIEAGAQKETTIKTQRESTSNIHEMDNEARTISSVEKSSTKPTHIPDEEAQKIHGYEALAEAMGGEEEFTHVTQQDDILKKDRLAGLPAYNDLPNQP